ncbi:peptidylprolyl isomerase [Mesoterricola silvestris]|uniref:Peptidyl-prolyl cis-trans isomerase n=1 Tax=Mesoterricola silvestris TaxID=2927979 RepID=A0AA48K9B3_9BACT|nr:peptidylprolyl isomerase [Mesoterricola silvestris]BDU73266.1 peptidyl-prolyl cis-trans isomerase [Mesoterricola silvestris]
MRIRTLAFALAAVAALAANPKVKFTTTLGSFTLELDPEAAPKTVDNFLGYVKSGHYKGTTFHRVISKFMIQGGGMTAQGAEKPTRAPIQNEAKQAQEKGWHNVRGTVAMARTGAPHSATSQFFVNVVDNAFLDFPGQDGWGYCVFGKVVDGMDTVDKIRDVKTLPGDRPQTPVVITGAVLEGAPAPVKRKAGKRK